MYYIVEGCKKKFICGVYGEGYYASVECINVLSVCNGISDCTDGIDELHCSKYSTYAYCVTFMSVGKASVVEWSW